MSEKQPSAWRLTATPKMWDGVFRLHSRYGVEVLCHFDEGRVQATVKAKRHTQFRLQHPSSAEWTCLRLRPRQVWEWELHRGGGT